VAAVQAQEYFRGRVGEQTFEVIGGEEEESEGEQGPIPGQGDTDRSNSDDEDEHVPIWEELNDMQNNPEKYQDNVTVFGR